MTDAEPQPPRQIDRAIPRDLETIVLKAIAKDPTERYVSAQQFADDLQRFMDDQPILAKRATLVERAAKWTRRNRAATVAALAVVTTVFVTAVALSIYSVQLARLNRRLTSTNVDLETAKGESEQKSQQLDKALGLVRKSEESNA